MPSASHWSSRSWAWQRFKQGADCGPQLFLDLNGKWIRKLRRGLVALLYRRKNADREFPVCIVPVSSPVSPQDGGPDPRDLEKLIQPAPLAEIGDESVSLGIDVWSDVVGDLTGAVAES